MKNSMKGLFIVIVTLILSSCLKEDLLQQLFWLLLPQRLLPQHSALRLATAARERVRFLFFTIPTVTRTFQAFAPRWTRF